MSAYAAPGIPTSQAPPQLPAGNIYSAQSLMNPTSSGPVPIISKPISTTRILLLSGFDPELKTRDILAVFNEWEDLFRIKWIDDRSAYIVFQDPLVAKKAFLATISNMPPSLTSSIENPSLVPAKLLPYTGPETDSILSSAAGRARSGSRAGMMQTNAAPGVPGSANGGGHRRSSSSANGTVGMMGHTRRTSIGGSGGGSSAKGFVNGIPPSGAKHSPSSSFHTRGESFGQGLQSSPPRGSSGLAAPVDLGAARASSPNTILLASAGNVVDENEEAVEDGEI